MVADGMVTASTIGLWLSHAQDELTAEADHLSALDAALGDGDHGTNMRRGFRAVGAALAGHPRASSPGELLMLAGKTILATVGGASGALWGLALRRAGRVLGDGSEVDGLALANALDAMVDAVMELGQTSAGDKTMLDALIPAASAFREAFEATGSLEVAGAAAARAARAGADATAHMEARKGRASFMGARSLGHQDPSANSTAIVFASLARALAKPLNGIDIDHAT